MSTVTIKLLNPELMLSFYVSKDPVVLARKLLVAGEYTVAGTMAVDLEGEAAAEEVFDLTNNPSRQEEREELYGRGRSVSVGDIVSVDGRDYLCASVGWQVL